MTPSTRHLNNDRGDDLDRQINRTLTALGRVDPSPHLQDRVLQAVAHSQPLPGSAAHNPSGSGAEALVSPFLQRVISTGADLGQRSGETLVFRPGRHFGLVAGTLALCAAAMLLLLVRNNRPRTPQQPSRNSLATQPSPAITEATTPGAPSSPAVSSPVKVGLLPPTPTHPDAVHAHLELTLTNPATNPTTDPDQQALADLQTPSFPAPPLPPTPQERLVCLMLRRGEKQDLAQLDPDREPDLQRAETAAFRTFFEPSANTQEEAASPQDKPSSTKAEKAPQP